jgi:D-alanine-D-alanine ligase
VGDAVLPISEIDFANMPKGMWPIVTYRSKWERGCDEDLGSVPQCPADLPARVASESRRVAMEAWKQVGGHGYARVDIRVDADGRPWILEVNANPDIAPDAGLAGMARVAGVEYGALMRQICELGIQRGREWTMQPDGWALAQKLSGMPVPATVPAPVPAVAPELQLFAGRQR